MDFNESYGGDLSYPSSSYNASYNASESSYSTPPKTDYAMASKTPSESMSTSTVVIIICLVAVFAIALSGLILSALAYTRTPSEQFSAIERGQLAALAAQTSSLTALNDAITLQTVGTETWIQAQGFTDGSATSASSGQRFVASDGNIEGSTFTASGNLVGDGKFTGANLVLSGSITVDDTSTVQNVFIDDGAMTITSNGAQSAVYGHTNITMGDGDLKVSTVITNNAIHIDDCPVSRLLAINSGTHNLVTVTTLTDITPSVSTAIGKGSTVDVSSLEVGSVIIVEAGGGSLIDDKLLTLTVCHNNGGAVGTWDALGGVQINTPPNGTVANLNWTLRVVLRVTAITSGPTTITFQPAGMLSVGESASSQFFPVTGSLTTVTSSTITFAVTALVVTAGDISTSFFKITREA